MKNTGELNRARVFELIHLFEPLSRSEIAAKLGLTSAAVSNIVAELLDKGVIVELGRRSSSRGQPAIELGVCADAAHTVGLHFEHGGISGILADLKGHVIERRHTPLSPLPSPDCVVNALTDMGKELIELSCRDKLLGIGLASVGPIDQHSGSVMRTDFTSDWGVVALREPLCDAFEYPVFMDNNASAAAIGEYWYGVGRSYPNFLYVGFYSMGLGGGLILNKRIYRGAGLNAAEFGHMLVNVDQADASTPAYLEKFVSGHALCRDLGSDILESLQSKLLAADQPLERWLDVASSAFASALVSVDHLLDLDAVIVGGQLPSVFLDALLERVDSKRDSLYMQGWTRRSILRKGLMGEDSAVLGAATLPIYDAFSPGSYVPAMSRAESRTAVAGGSIH